ncbi:hypothetical protein, partial [Thiolapillus sp.]|uniref:hypothetical protein n=1 Tax=Thiolapillus sp. TaxID=2017437 RepID=UPI003AF52E9A
IPLSHGRGGTLCDSLLLKNRLSQKQSPASWAQPAVVKSPVLTALYERMLKSVEQGTSRA